LTLLKKNRLEERGIMYAFTFQLIKVVGAIVFKILQNVISSDPQNKYGNARFTTVAVPLKALVDQF